MTSSAGGVDSGQDAAQKAAAIDDPAVLLVLPETRVSRRIDSVITRLGDVSGWIWVVLLVVIVSNVVLRYAFGEGRIEFEEIQWHLYSIGFLFGLGFCVTTDAHIRVDVLRERFTPRVRAWIDLYGILLLLLPFIALIAIYSVPFIGHSFAQSEVSAAPGGLPLRWVIKSALLSGFALLGCAAFSRLLRIASFLFGAPRPLPPGAASNLESSSEPAP